MLSEKVSFVVSTRADQTIQLGIAEPAGIGITGNPVFPDRVPLEPAFERNGLPSALAAETGVTLARRVSFVQVSLGFF